MKRLVSLAAALLLAVPAAAWNANTHRMVTNKAVDTLPPDVRPFFEANRNFLVQHSVDPLEWVVKNPNEKMNQFIRLDHYGKFPFRDLPRDYQAAVRKYSKHTLDANGLLPWQIGVYSEKLTNAFRARRWEDAKLAAAILAFYVAEAHDPFNTTENFDGKLSGQAGVNLRFGSSLVDRYSLFFFLRPNDASYISDPTLHAFDTVMNSHAWLENILLGDLRARQGLSDYTDEYYDRFYNQEGAVLVRQISDSATDVGSYWLTAWTNAGRPQLPGN